MLRIKDNVDLKELEKYGYLQGKDTLNVPYSAYGKVFEVDYSEELYDTIIDVVQIDKKTKQIELIRTSKKAFRGFINDNVQLLEFYINDLITAGLVEKVDQ